MSNLNANHDDRSIGWSSRRQLKTGVAVAALALSVGATAADAAEFQMGEVQGFVDTTVSAGASIRTSARDCENVGSANGGCPDLDAAGLLPSSGGATNGDDGNLNYDQWDVFSAAFKATSEVQLGWRNFTAFARGTAFYDPAVTNTDFRNLEDAQRSEIAQSAKMLDYFISGSFEVGNQPLDVRVGNQVISWGESTFIQNGINVINPIDVAAARKPGSEIKEFFTPVLAAHASLGLPNNFSLEGFYQFKSDNIVPDPSGTFFSSADIVGRGSQPLKSGSNDFGDDMNQDPVIGGVTVPSNPFAVGLPAQRTSAHFARANDVNAKDGGEYGAALRYYAENFNQGTEFGLYFMNYHSRLPILQVSMSNPAAAFSNQSGTNFGALGAGSSFGTGPGGALVDAFEVGETLCNLAIAPVAGVAPVSLRAPGGRANCTAFAQLLPGVASHIESAVAAVIANTNTFRLEYPEDIKLLGASFSTTFGDIAVQGEFSYRHDAPFSYSTSEMLALSDDLDGQTRFKTGAAPDPVNGTTLPIVTAGVTATATNAAAAFGAPTSNGTGPSNIPAGTPIDPFGGAFVGANPGLTAATAADAAAVALPNANGPAGAPAGGITRASALDGGLVNSDGFLKIRREDMFTAQTTFTQLLFASHPFIMTLGADQGTLITEFGMVYVPGISSADGLSASGTSGLANTLASQYYHVNKSLKYADNLPTRFSWGAQGRVQVTYNRLFGTPFNVSPRLNWRYDINGRTPAPYGNYQEDRKSISIGANATYLSSWTGSVSWTHNFGPDAPLSDRDFASLNVSYAF